MPRSGAAARARLREAALELYRERGYDATTTAEIAARAGVTERTYFRHFADKREVLFDGETELRDVMVGAIASASDEVSALSLVLGAYTAAIPLFVAGRPTAERRAGLIATTPALRERAQSKSATLTEALIQALVERRVAEPAARLAAGAGAVVFEYASRAWDGTTATGLAALITRATDELHALTTP
ncbi:helix-turn-helix domain-containing protein [Actinoplanes sp. NPDC051851]|uniref:TetR/AcrR family transcriptional regulator n=1 Tax=Actinoplanes sp. NPDC051851 TaxID=3154753 RepID=UPI0034242B84